MELMTEQNAEVQEANDWVDFAADNGVSISLGTILLIMLIVKFQSQIKNLLSALVSLFQKK